MVENATSHAALSVINPNLAIMVSGIPHNGRLSMAVFFAFGALFVIRGLMALS